MAERLHKQTDPTRLPCSFNHHVRQKACIDHVPGERPPGKAASRKTCARKTIQKIPVVRRVVAPFAVIQGSRTIVTSKPTRCAAAPGVSAAHFVRAYATGRSSGAGNGLASSRVGRSRSSACPWGRGASSTDALDTSTMRLEQPTPVIAMRSRVATTLTARRSSQRCANERSAAQ